MTADFQAAGQCSGCGASLAPGAAWCSQCYLPRAATPSAHSIQLRPATPGLAAGERSILSGTNVQAAAAGPRQMVSTRWKKTPTTFGPVGRVSWTAFLIVVMIFLIVGAFFLGGLDIAGVGAWALVMRWGLRDLWKAGQLPAE